MLSLNPRFDLFKFTLPKDFLPEEVENKYASILNRESGVVVTPIDYLNESIQSINIPGISDLVIQQEQHENNPIRPRLGKINVEPKHDINYLSSGNPLEKLGKEFKVTFRMNQGLYNYFMIYETIFHRYVKQENNRPYDPVFLIDILNEDGTVVSRIKLKDLYIDSIDGLDFNYNKVEREANTFDVSFKFNNIDFVFIVDGEER